MATKRAHIQPERRLSSPEAPSFHSIDLHPEKDQNNRHAQEALSAHLLLKNSRASANSHCLTRSWRPTFAKAALAARVGTTALLESDRMKYWTEIQSLSLPDDQHALARIEVAALLRSIKGCRVRLEATALCRQYLEQRSVCSEMYLAY